MFLKDNNGFKVLRLPVSKEYQNGHEIFFKAHTVRERIPGKPEERTLFVLNIPPFADENGLKKAFKEAGQIEYITFSSRPMAGELPKNDSLYFRQKDIFSFKVAYIVFSKPSGLQKALKLKKLSPMASNVHQLHTGLQKWIRQYNDSHVDVDDLNSEIKSFMESFDNKSKEEAIIEKISEPNDDGWVTVTKKGRKPGFSRSQNVEVKILEKEKIGKKKKELSNFYTFQIREAKMKHLASLRQKFEEDKKKIAHLKQSRKFKPF